MRVVSGIENPANDAKAANTSKKRSAAARDLCQAHPFFAQTAPRILVDNSSSTNGRNIRFTAIL